MPTLKQSDLVLDYSWTAIKPDDPKATGVPDSSLLNRKEGYEVLAFINRYAANKGLDKAKALKVEKLIREKLPSDQRSHKNVKAWLDANLS